MQISSDFSILFSLITLVVLFAALLWLYKGDKTNKWLMLLRVPIVVIISLLIINPFLKEYEENKLEKKFLVLLDESESVDSTKTKAITKEINELFSDDKLKLVIEPFADGLISNEVNKKQTNIVKSIKELERKYQNQIAEVLLISDGISNQGQNINFIDNKTYPIHTIGVGDTSYFPDVAIVKFSLPKSANKGASFALDAVITVPENLKTVDAEFAYNGKSEKLKLSAQNGIIYFYREMDVADDKNIMPVSLKIDGVANEQNLLNNERSAYVKVKENKKTFTLVHNGLHQDISVWTKALSALKDTEVKLFTLGNYKPTKEKNEVVVYFDYLGNNNREVDADITILGSKALKRNRTNGLPIKASFRNGIFTEVRPNGNANANYFNWTNVADLNQASLPPVKQLFGSIEIGAEHHNFLNKNTDGIVSNEPLFSVLNVDGENKYVWFGEGTWVYNTFWQANLNRDENPFYTLLQNAALNVLNSKLGLRLEVTPAENIQAGLSKEWVVKVLNPNSETVPNLTVNAKVLAKNELLHELILDENNGFYSLAMPPLAAGVYQVIFNTEVDGKNIKTENTFAVEDYNLELANTQADFASLRKLAQNTGANSFEDLESLKSFLNQYQAPQLSSVQYKLSKNYFVEKKWLLAILILLFAADWYLRRTKGLK